MSAFRLMMLLLAATPLAGCFSYTEATPSRVIVAAPPPPSGTVVVQPQPAP